MILCYGIGRRAVAAFVRDIECADRLVEARLAEARERADWQRAQERAEERFAAMLRARSETRP